MTKKTSNYDPSKDPLFLEAVDESFNAPVPGAPNADPIAAAGTINTQPNAAEKLIANPEDPNSVLSVRYNPDGTVMRADATVLEADLGPESNPPAVTSDDYPLAADKVPVGWNRFPTAEEIAYFNEKLAPVEATPPAPPPAPAPEA